MEAAKQPRVAPLNLCCVGKKAFFKEMVTSQTLQHCYVLKMY